MRTGKHTGNILSQSAVFLPIAAVVALGVLTFLFLLIGYTGRVKFAQSELRAKLDITCGDIAYQETFSQKMDLFKRRVEELNAEGSLRYSKITEAVLILPTMPDLEEDEDFPFPPAVVESHLGPLPDPISMSCGPDLNCKIYRQISSFAGQYPPKLWNNIRNAGNTVGCEFKAAVKADFISPYFRSKLNPDYFDLSMKSVWWTPVRGPTPSFISAENIATSPGLSIAVATEMFTTSWDKRFRFKPSDPPAPGEPRPRLEAYNPLLRHDRFFRSAESLSANSNVPAGGAIPSIPQVATPSAARMFDWSPSPWPPGPPPARSIDEDFSFNDMGGWSGLPSDRDGLLTACMNPAILVRNTFLSTIIELAGRHGQLRNMTEIIHINPMHRDLSFYPPGGGYIPNFPTKIVSFGQDLMQKQYQLPYVFFHTGNAGSLPSLTTSNFRWFDQLGFNTYPSLGGYINPFQKTGGGAAAWQEQPDPETAKRHALVASQLRLCYDLYGPDNNSENADLPRFPAFQNFLNESEVFEPEIYDRYREVGSGDWINSRTRISDSGNWDQKCQFGNCASETENLNEHLSAAQVISALGSTQMCPYNYKINDAATGNKLKDYVDLAIGSDDGSPSFEGGNPCPLTYPPSFFGSDLDPSIDHSTPANGSGNNALDEPLELKPDLVGALMYLNQERPAIPSPGLFPLSNAAVAPGQNPFAAGTPPLTTAESMKSAILIVLHQSFSQTDSQIIEQIREQVTKLSTGPVPFNSGSSYDLRPITVVFIPTNYRDHMRIHNLRYAFNIIDFSAPPSPVTDEIFFSSDARGYKAPITFYNISPYDEFWGPPCNGLGNSISYDGNGDVVDSRTAPPSVTKRQSELFQDYWTCLLTDPSANVVSLANRVFQNRILRKELKF